MEVEFAHDDLDRLEIDPKFTAGLGRDPIKGFRKAMQVIRSAVDERDLYNLKGLHFEKMHGTRPHQRSIRFNKQWRLILELKDTAPEKTVRVVSIEDYHR
jgi:proteic killer suppression protein